MLEKLGKKAVAAPFALIIVLTCVLSLAVAPLLQASPHDLSLAIVNLDEGVATPAGTVNAGAVLADKLTGEESEAAQESTAAMAALAASSAATSGNTAAAAGAGANVAGAATGAGTGAAGATAADASAAMAAAANASAADTPTADANAAETLAANGAAAAAAAATGASSATDSASDSDETADSASASSTSSAMADALRWEAFDSEDELQDQFGNNELFGGIVIPADFTAQQLAAKTSDAKPQVTVYLNMGKNPQVASSLQAAMAQSLSVAGIDADIQMVNSAEVGGGMMAGLMAVQMMVMPLLVMTLSSSLILALLTWKRDIWGLRARSPWLAVAGQIGLVAVLSACIAGCALAIDVWAGGLDLPCGQLFLWLWLGCACVMLSFVGLADACLPLGALFAVCVFALGMGTAMLPAEMLPTFWADWVFPWAPQAHLGQGVRTIIYCGQTPATADMTALLAFAGIGIVALLIAAGLAHGKRTKAAA